MLVEVGGFRWDGQTYRSLSAAATAIAGSKWNAAAFTRCPEDGDWCWDCVAVLSVQSQLVSNRHIGPLPGHRSGHQVLPLDQGDRAACFVGLAIN